MKKVKYVVYPSYVESKNDGQFHFVNFSRLVKLYGVDPEECINVHNTLGRDISGLIPLRVRHDGNYKLEEK